MTQASVEERTRILTELEQLDQMYMLLLNEWDQNPWWRFRKADQFHHACRENLARRHQLLMLLWGGPSGIRRVV